VTLGLRKRAAGRTQTLRRRFDADDARPEAQHVVVLDTLPCGKGIVTGRPRTGRFVGCDRRTDAAACTRTARRAPIFAVATVRAIQ
jgi:hypothetical protein